MQVGALHAAYLARTLSVREVAVGVLARVADRGEDHVWISRVPDAEVLAEADRLDDVLEQVRAGALRMPPLLGVPFGVKDNIDVVGVPTTAACPAFGYLPEETSVAVARVLAAGALLVGKTNLDQFATGLSGARSPYGTPTTPFDRTRISGGSSSGSGVAVSAGLVSFALGTDTAGSGRVPAALTSVVGLKPTRGLVPTRGVLPACRSLDCVSVFALSVADGSRVLAVMAGPDGDDPWSRTAPGAPAGRLAGRSDLGGAVLGVLAPAERARLGGTDAEAYGAVLDRATSLGAALVEVDLEPLLAAGTLLYEGPWVAERMAAVGDFVRKHADDVHPAVAAVLARADRVTGEDAFRGVDRLAGLALLSRTLFDTVDALLLPTVPRTFTVAEMGADPVGANAALGRWTTFDNLLDLAVVAFPGALVDVVGADAPLPFGVSLHGPAWSDATLAAMAAQLHGSARTPVGAIGEVLLPWTAPAPSPGVVRVAVVGAHLRGLALHGQLVERDARFVADTATSPDYRLFALPAGADGVARPGLVRTPGAGAAVAVEVYAMTTAALGSLLALVPAPLAIGTLQLADGDTCLGFLCEQHAVTDATDVTAAGGWRAYLASSPG